MPAQTNNHERMRDTIDRILFFEIQPSDSLLPPWLFRHDDLVKTMASAGRIDKPKLTNALNHLHFKEDPLYILLHDPRYEEMILVKAHPDPCLGNELTFHWDPAYADYRLERYQCKYLVVTHDQSVILAPAEVLATPLDGLTVQLPELSLLISKRQTPRFPSQSVKAELWQSGFQAEGDLVDFGPDAFRIRVESASPSSFYWFNIEAPATIRLSEGKDVFYSGHCNCLYQKQNGRSREIVLSPAQDRIQRFKAKVLRNPRRQPAPPLQAAFDHPFTRKKVQREIFDISTSGFSICDGSGEAALMPGLIIPDMAITYAGILKIHCKVQVIYRKEMAEESIRYGLSILDMDMKNYSHLNQLLNNLPGLQQNMTSEVDLDQLWDLFFESNFIYPAKYKNIQSYRKAFQETYRKLYEDSPEIAKHFTYQKDGHIYSHIALLRAYDRTWMAHHHAARAADGRHTGLFVLKQMISYLYDMNRLPSAHLEYYLCYYRPGNKFTDRIYTEFCKEKSDPGRCSIDLFAYLTLAKKNGPERLPEGWVLRECSGSDLWEFEQFYKHRSGGLLLNVLSLDDPSQRRSLEKAYAEMGLIRRWNGLALKCGGELKALIVAEESDVAINLSDLLNGFKILVMDPEIPPEILLTAVGNMATQYPLESLPLLIYPADYVQKKGLRFEKQYLSWIMDAQLGNDFVEYLGRRFRMSFT